MPVLHTSLTDHYIRVAPGRPNQVGCSRHADRLSYNRSSLPAVSARGPESTWRSSRPTDLTKTYRVFQKKEGVLARLARAVSAANTARSGPSTGQLHDRARRDGRVPRAQRRRQDHDAEDALGLDLSDQRRRPACSVSCPGSAPTRFAASSRWSWARRTSSGGTCRPPTASSSTARSTRSRRPSSTDPRRADRAARRREADPPGRARAVAGRADEDGADRRPAAPAAGCCCSTSRRSAWTSWPRWRFRNACATITRSAA